MNTPGIFFPIFLTISVLSLFGWIFLFLKFYNNKNDSEKRAQRFISAFFCRGGILLPLFILPHFVLLNPNQNHQNQVNYWVSVDGQPATQDFWILKSWNSEVHFMEPEEYITLSQTAEDKNGDAGEITFNFLVKYSFQGADDMLRGKLTKEIISNDFNLCWVNCLNEKDIHEELIIYENSKMAYTARLWNDVFPELKGKLLRIPKEYKEKGFSISQFNIKNIEA